ncbi:MAG TPA: FAD-binding oxidoreductase, partial [Rhizomicrobium sp.]|nr:FAD-binding oxidoreductase [Rhizomicrobium sp.]
MQPGLERRLKAHMAGDVLFDPFSRGRYATDASHYQMMPAGVVVPRGMDDAVAALAIAREEGVPVTPRGGGTSQCGQTVNSGLIVDGSKTLNRVLSLDVAARTVTVEPGIVLDDLNRQLKKHGLWFPVDVSTASRATIGGMTANNSCGGRSIRYGTMRANVLAIDAMLADGAAVHLGEVAPDLSDVGAGERGLAEKLLAIGAREAAEVEARFPKVHRRVGGYNIDALNPRNNRINLAHVLVGSEGTLAYSTAITLLLSPVLGNRALGVCHFGSFHAAMDAAQHLVTLKPIAVELVDDTMLGLAAEIPMFHATLEAMLRGKPQAILLVEFDSGEE